MQTHSIDAEADASVERAATEDPPERVGSSDWWRHTALRLRAALAFGLLSLLLSSALSLTTFGLVRSNLLAERQTVAERQAYTNARLLRTRIDPLPSDMAQLLAGLQVDAAGDSLLMVDGRWFASSVEVTPTDLPDPLLDAVGGSSAARQAFELRSEPMLGVGVPIASVGAEYFEISSLAEVESTLDSLGRSLLIAGTIATIVGALLGAAFSSVILQPLRRFAAVAGRVTAGDPLTRLDAGGDADLEPLASSFNEMLDELDARMERERRFASDVSHEIRGPVAALASAVSIVDRRRDQLPAEIVPVVDALDEQVTAFNQLVLDLLEISRFDARTAMVSTETVDLLALCERVASARGHDEVDVRSRNGTVLAEADPRRVEQVVANLLDNAAFYAGGATDLVVSHDDGVSRIEVLDRGPGVAVQERTEIFSRFRRGSAADAPGAPSGTGLGLAVSHQHIELHQGSLWVEDRDGGGARFVVELPDLPDDETIGGAR